MPIKKILIVDDSPTEVQAQKEMLTKAGYQVVSADGGEKGVAMTKSEKARSGADGCGDAGHERVSGVPRDHHG